MEEWRIITGETREKRRDSGKLSKDPNSSLRSYHQLRPSSTIYTLVTLSAVIPPKDPGSWPTKRLWLTPRYVIRGQLLQAGRVPVKLLPPNSNSCKSTCTHTRTCIRALGPAGADGSMLKIQEPLGPTTLPAWGGLALPAHMCSMTEHTLPRTHTHADAHS